MKTIAVVCEKGGSGKTMIARELAYSFERQGVPCSYYSLDGQYEGATKKVMGAEVAVVDTPGFIMSDDVKKVVKTADAVIIPVRPTGNDTEPFIRTLNIVRELNPKEPLIVVNGTNHWKICTQFLNWIHGRDWAKNVVEIPQSEAIVQGITMRKSVMGIDRGNARDAVMRMVRTAQQMAGAPVEPMPVPKRKLGANSAKI